MGDMASDSSLRTLRDRLIEHPLYAALREPRDVVIFLQHHVFCVWDFMSLLKALQRRLTCVDVPWTPTSDPAARRLINEIVLGEESDDDGQGGHLSHFELYLAAMRDAGADTRPIRLFLETLAEGETLDAALDRAATPPATSAFVHLSLGIAQSAPLHSLASAFALGREDLIPSLFVRLLETLAESEPARFGRLLYYLRRHIDLDGDSHGPASHRLLDRVCSGEGRRREALAVAARCLEARLSVWDEIHAAVVAPRRELVLR
jgi:hypothetical protein